MEFYANLADVLAFAHFVYVGFVVLGTLAILIGGVFGVRWVRNPWFRGIHLWMTVIVPFEVVCTNDYECPLTTIEYDLRALGGELPLDYRTVGIGQLQTGFIARNLHSLIPDNPAALVYAFIGFGATVLGSLLIFPPRRTAMIVALNACSMSILYVCWLYAGTPSYCGGGAWTHGDAGMLACVWNALPFVIAGLLAIYLRDSKAASVVICAAVLLECGVGPYILKTLRVSASDGELSTFEWLMPVRQLTGLLVAVMVARTLRPQSST